MKEVYLLALGANLCFAVGSQVFTHYSRTISSKWMNCAKALVAMICFALFIGTMGNWNPISYLSISIFILSGVIGLGVGDVFLLKSFSEMGPGRTLILFGFQPLILGTLAYFLFDQTVDAKKFWAILCCILCVVTFAFESFKKDGHWQLKGILIAFAGMTLDALGLILTRYNFDKNPAITAMEGNFYRCLGAIIFFMVLSRVKPLNFFSLWNSQTRKSKLIIILGSIFGTFLSLGLYLKAIQSAHLASLSGVAITGAIFSATLECVVEKKWPSKYLLMAFAFFIVGMKVIFF